MFKLALDAGHGLHTAGKRCLKSLDINETREWVLNSRICNKLQEKLKEYDGIEVKRMDNVSGKTDVSLAQRCKTANEWGADFYLSIHHNAGINGGNGGGLVVFRYNKLSASGETAQWQKTFYEQLIKSGVPKGNRATPINTATFTVLADTKMKAILVECGFMDSIVDTPLILTEEFADKVVDGIINALVILAGIKKKAVKVEEAPVITEPEVPENEIPNGAEEVAPEGDTTQKVEENEIPEAEEKETAPKKETVEEKETAEESASDTVELPQKKSWVELVKDVLKLILEWLHLINNNN